MKNINYSLLFVLMIIFCQAQKRQSTELIKVQKELTDKLTKIIENTSFNGFGVALVNDHDILYQNGFGVATLKPLQKYDENTVQNIASVSKTLIGIAVLKAQELGKLKLDDPVNQYLPFKVTNPYHPQIPVTIRQLTTHTSSINDNSAYLNNTVVLKDTVDLANHLHIDISPTHFNPPSAKISIEEFLTHVLSEKGKWYAKDVFTENKPGELFNYSNIGATLAALVLEKATGMSYDTFTAKYILGPLQMNHSGWKFNAIHFSRYTQTFINKQTPYPYYSLNTYPDGGLLTTSSDMSKYLLELMKGYFGNGSILSKESYKEYFTPQLKAENFKDRSNSEYSDEYNMGITMGFGSTGNFGHTGGDPGMNSVIWFFKDQKMGRYLIVNTDWDQKVSGKDQKAIYDLLDEYFIKLDALSRLKR
ncbi:serine hydrolase domain-containing protein [Chryseobacterium sp. Bi04]|uniref:serine hydrolase domain-containing protein n=1 Tax=Chryseobacterium sp. Bi04 TaxID=2822345 RepID=UPI001DC4DE97|nr:serine hydrolase domain-containing protein [Chryseobacterium sp. Bi04]CAH0243304.1 Penicillin-binding protein 4* [Chryseobacterium sp. Bi04]